MKMKIAIVFLVLCALPQGTFSRDGCGITSANLEIFLNEENNICGTYTLTFTKGAIIYFNEISSISPMLGHWLEIRFDGDEKKYFLKNYTMVLFPHEDDVKAVKPGESVSFSFAIGNEYWLEDENGVKRQGLPAGRYAVVANLVIPDDSRVDRLGIHKLDVVSNVCDLVVDAEEQSTTPSPPKFT